jgi:hypothetical protein
MASSNIFRPLRSHPLNVVRTRPAGATKSSLVAAMSPFSRSKALALSSNPPIPDDTLPSEANPYLLPKPAYHPGDWRNEWNSVAKQVGLPALTDDASTPRSS